MGCVTLQITVASNHRVSGINRCLAVQTEAIKQLSDTGDVVRARFMPVVDATFTLSFAQDGSRQAENHLRLMKRELQSEAILKTQVLTVSVQSTSCHCPQYSPRIWPRIVTALCEAMFDTLHATTRDDITFHHDDFVVARTHSR